jgi:hypothetical protein
MEPEPALKLYRGLLRWAAERGDHFEFGYEPSMYDITDDVARFQALGQVAGVSPQSCTNTVVVRGRLSEPFVVEMTRQGAPDRAAAGDESPVDFIVIYSGERALYVSYDYGTVQTMDLTDSEVESLRQDLAHLGVESWRVVPL